MILARYIIRRLLIVLLAWDAICLAFLIFLSRINVDYPCGSPRRDEEGCWAIPGRGRVDDIEQPRIQLLISEGYAGMSGGGCLYEQSATDRASAGGYTVERRGDEAILNGRSFPTGASIAAEHLFGVDPWTTSSNGITNIGVVRACARGVRPSRDAGLVLHGYSNGSFSPLKGILVTTALLLAFFSIGPAPAPRQRESLMFQMGRLIGRLFPARHP